MKLVPKRTADYVSVPWDERRTESVWAALQSPTRARPRFTPRTLALSVASLAAVAAVLLVVLVSRTRKPIVHAPVTPAPSLAGRVIDTHGAMQPLALPDGSTVLLEAESRMAILTADTEHVRVRLENGSIVCDVRHRDARTFVIEVGDGEVAVRGTRFRVTMQPAAKGWGVRVEEGSVLVRRTQDDPGQLLESGAAWTSTPPTPPAPPHVAQPTVPEPAVPEPAVPEPASPEPAPHRARRDALDARALFSRADAARLDRRHADAASDLAQLLRRFPRDPRVDLAAYQLGRIRLYTLHQPDEAIRAFTFVIEHAPRSPFLEEAQSARIEAADQLGDKTRCIAWRDAFLDRHPESVFAERTRARCR